MNRTAAALITLFIGLVVGLATPAWAASCGPGDVTGLFTGIAKPPHGLPFEVTLNLLCSQGVLHAQVLSSKGDFAVTDASAEKDRVTVTFESGSQQASLHMRLNGDTLEGDFGGGTASFKKSGDALVLNGLDPHINLTPAQWREDLHYLAAELPKRHANAFFFISKAKFDAEIAALDRRIATDNDDEILVGLQKIARSIGDGHTQIMPPSDVRQMPLRFGKFGDDIRVIATGPGLDRAMDARVIKVGGLPIAAVWQRLLTLTAGAELMPLRREDALALLSQGYALHGLDIMPTHDHAIYTLKPDQGAAFDADTAASPPGQSVTMRSGISNAATRYQDPDKAFWCKAMDKNAVYCTWRNYHELAQNAQAMFSLIDSVRAQKLIIDMRDNHGGDNKAGDTDVIQPIAARPGLNRKGHLYVLIGAETFSAGMDNAAQFQDETKAVLVGETIGEKPNSYQESRLFRLPNSHLVTWVSILYYAFRKTGENAVRPNKEILPSWYEVRDGRDPVLDWALSRAVP